MHYMTSNMLKHQRGNKENSQKKMGLCVFRMTFERNTAESLAWMCWIILFPDIVNKHIEVAKENDNRR